MSETLQDLIDARGLSHEDVASRAGITVRGLAKLRGGQVASPRPTTLASLAKALRVPTKRLRIAIGQSRAAALA